MIYQEFEKQDFGKCTIVYPLKSSRERTTQFFGNICRRGDEYAEINMKSTDEELRKIETFYKEGLKYGSTPFLIDIPHFGKETVADKPTEKKVAVRIVSAVEATKENTVWSQTWKVLVIGIVAEQGNDGEEASYITDDSGATITDNSGKPITDDSYRFKRNDGIEIQDKWCTYYEPWINAAPGKRQPITDDAGNPITDDSGNTIYKED